MSRRKRCLAAALGVVLAALLLWLVVPGFCRQGSVYVKDYAPAPDGSQMTLTLGVSGSMGYVRKVTPHQQQGGKLYLDCYAAFGGPNGSWGAQEEFVVDLDPDTQLIALYRGENAYQTVLEKDSDGQWQLIWAGWKKIPRDPA